MLLMEFPVNEKALLKLSSWASVKNVSHAYIFQGDARINMRLLAKTFAKAVLCKNSPGEGCLVCESCKRIDGDNYEDLHFLQLAGLSIQDDMLSELLVNLKTKPIGGDRNIAVIDNADTMTLQAQNRLLKTLEEPNPGTIIILLSENVEHLVATIKSRCVLVAFESTDTPFNSQMEAMASELATSIYNQCTFRDARNVVQDLLKDKEKGRIRTLEFLDYLQGYYGKTLRRLGEDEEGISPEDIFNIIEKIEETRRSIEKKGSYTYALKNMLLEIGG